MNDRATAGALLDAAEVAFGASGVDGGSLRSIMRSAGANPNSVHYHFGSRQALEQAVLERILEPLQQRRLDLLRDLLRRTDAPTVADLVEALVRPDYEAMLRVSERNPDGARVIGAIYCRPPANVKALVEESFGPVANQFVPHFASLLSHITPDEMSWRVRWGVFAVLGAVLSDAETDVTAETSEDQLARMVAMATGALTAPSTEKERK